MVSGRSPAYPYIDLSTGIDFIHKIHGVAKGHNVNTESLAKQIGFSGLNGSSKKTLAALKYYGLIDQPHGSKETKLSERALHIIHGVSGSQEQKQAIQEAFLAPSIYAYCWDTWGNDLISDEIIKSHLILKKGFNDSTVMKFISGYKKSLNFSGMVQSPDADEPDTEIESPAIGNYIQWESQGVLQFPQPMKVKSVDEEQGYLFVEGSQTGVPIGETFIEEFIPPSTPPGGGLPHLTPPPPGVGAQAAGAGYGANMRQETFTLSESEILIQFPSNMTMDDYEDFEGWIDILKRKIKRSIKTEEQR